MDREGAVKWAKEIAAFQVGENIQKFGDDGWKRDTDPAFSSYLTYRVEAKECVRWMNVYGPQSSPRVIFYKTLEQARKAKTREVIVCTAVGLRLRYGEGICVDPTESETS